MMESCIAVEREIDKLLSKYDAYEGSFHQGLDELIQHVASIRDGICEGSPDCALSPLQLHILNACAKRVKEMSHKFATEHKELHGFVSKIGRAVERNFVSDYSGTTQEGVFAGEKAHLLNEVICEHMLRQGQVDIAEVLINEAGLTIDANQKEPFLELNYILNECKSHNLEPALEWAQCHHEELLARNSSLEFKLHKLKFLDLIRAGEAEKALQYSRHFSEFKDHVGEIKRLMACFAFLKRGISNSPYVDLLDPINWLEINDSLAKEACALLGLSMRSPLEVSVTAGCLALPALLQIKQVMKQTQCTGVWNSKEELPIEVDLGNEYRYHSIFACPILRQQCGRTNPPMRLVCGHAISKDALNKLSSGSKLKCPYCPMEMDPKDAKQIKF